MPTKRTMLAQMERMKQDIATLRILCKAYMRRTAQLEEDIAMLNASLDCAAKEIDRWAEIAHKADERRLEYVRANTECAGDIEKAVG